jgi:hypothetical protein
MCVVCALLASTSLAQVPAPASTAQLPGALSTAAATWPGERVHHDEPGDGRLWSIGASWKASFARDGFTFVPYWPDAPHSFPLAFQLRSVRAGDRELAIARDTAPARTGDRVCFDRGAVREIYDLAPQQIEQSFVIDTALPGDLELELTIATELVEDAQRPGLQFGCAFGEVHYGEAFVVRGAEREALPATFADGVLRLRVPASLRGDGPVVIDPVLGTQPTTAWGVVYHPDVAYDATNDCYLVVWEHQWNVADHDIWTELFDGQGMPIPGSAAAIDFTTTYWSAPRVANLDASDRFLVVAQVKDPANALRSMIYARTRDAGGAQAMNTPQLLSNPNLPGDDFEPEVGADAGAGPGNHEWLVVWTNVRNSTESNVLGRLVDGAGMPLPPAVLTIQYAFGTNQQNAHAQVSRGNGAGDVAHPLWCVAYTRRISSSVSHVLVRTVDANGAIGGEQPIDDTSNDSVEPQISSPIRDGARARFLVVHRRGASTARGTVIAFDPAWQGTNFFDLSAQFGLIPDWLRVESDGARFVVISRDFFAGELDASTIGWSQGGLLLQNGPISLPGAGTDPEVAACHNSGGALGRYGVAWLRNGILGPAPVLSRYGGYSLGTMTTVRPTGCDGLAITGSIESVLGSTMQFALANYGTDFPCFAFGGAAANPIPLCPTCGLGLRLDLPIDVLPGDALAIAIPPDAALVGASFGVQGVSVGSGTCLGALRLSDTIQFTVR